MSRMYGGLTGEAIINCEASSVYCFFIRQGDQDTTKVGKRISRALSKVSATGFTHPPSSVGVACSGKRCQTLPRPHWMKPVARTVKTTLDMRFPTFVVP